jgi:hypothetical protein
VIDDILFVTGGNVLSNVNDVASQSAEKIAQVTTNPASAGTPLLRTTVSPNVNADVQRHRPYRREAGDILAGG